MIDPLKIFENITEGYKSYVKTAFHTRFSDFEEKRAELLNTDGVLHRQPWAEPLLTYKNQEGKRIRDLIAQDDLPGFNEEQAELFRKYMLNGLFYENNEEDEFELYTHQHEMMRRSLRGENCVITSGTGSGKTESFLLPLLGYLIKDLSKYIDKQEEINVDGPFTKGHGVVGGITQDENGQWRLSENDAQRKKPSRPAAIKALLIYPMNALVEDQMTRLRQALDSDVVRNYCNEKLNGNRLFYGRYNGTSPVSGKLFKLGPNGTERNDFAYTNLKKELKKIDDNYNKVEAYLVQNNVQDIKKIMELKANYQRLDGAEMRSRWDMQQTPPDILITNFSMLSIMLMRAVESGMLEETKKWLNCEDVPEGQREAEKKERIFHIVIDELHLYRGSAGTEVSYLIRLLYDRLGIDPSGDQLRILASSASLEGDPQDSQGFLKGFFGLENDMSIIKSTEVLPVEVAGEINSDIFIELDRIARDICTSDEEDFLTQLETGILNSNVIQGDAREFISEFNNNQILQFKLVDAFHFVNNDTNEDRHRPMPVFNKNTDEDQDVRFKSVARKLFGNGLGDEYLEKAIRGLFLFRGLFDTRLAEGIKSNLPRFRFHLFVRNIEGLWGTLYNGDEKVNGTETLINNLRNENPFEDLLNRGSIHYNDKRVFELLYCDNCGTTFAGGSYIDYQDNNNDFRGEIISTPPDIEGIPEKSRSAIVAQRASEDYAVFWPKYVSGHTPDDPQDGVWQERYLDPFTGRLYRVNTNEKRVRGYLYEPTRRSEKVETALPSCCPDCSADYSKRRFLKSPIRGFRTGFSKTNQVLAKELFLSIPSTVKKPRKLISFSDSREEAAKFSNDIEQENYSQIIREILLENKDVGKQVKELIELISKDETDSDRFIELRNKIDNISPEFLQELGSAIGAAKNVLAPPPKEQRILLENAKSGLISIDKLIRLIIEQLVIRGLNPAGPFASKRYLQAVVHPNYVNRLKFWSDCFDFENGKFNSDLIVTTDALNQIIIDIKSSIYPEIQQFLFGRLYYSFESMGLGVVRLGGDVNLPHTLNPYLSAREFNDIVNSTVRILGDTYRFFNWNFWPAPNFGEYRNHVSQPYIKYLRMVENIKGIPVEDLLGQEVWNVITERFEHHDGKLVTETLCIDFAFDDQKIYQCTNCQTIHLHTSGGVCKSCFQPIRAHHTLNARSVQETHFYARGFLREETGVRLRCEELTGQTDNQLERQRRFKGVILNEEKKPKEIDLLSVTTTLEVGVDIGSLQAIYQGNMSPMRFNYQQRVGRAGRAGQAYNMALTFCRGRSHDEYYFQNPHRITGDLSPLPFLSQSQKDILYRMVLKGLLREYYSMFNLEGSVHGEFGHIREALEQQNKERLRTWFEDHMEYGSVRRIFDILKKNLFVRGKLFDHDFGECEKWIRTFLNNLENILAANPNGDFAQILAENGYLPLSGSPTNVVNLITGFEDLEDDESDPMYKTANKIDRPLDQAIFEFAPGSQKTKDKRIYTSVGICPDVDSIKLFPRPPVPSPFNNLPWKNRFWVLLNTSNNVLETKTWCDDIIEYDENSQTLLDVIIPSAFRTDWNESPQDRQVEQEVNTSKPLIFSEAAGGGVVVNPQEHNYSANLASSDFTWRLNTNGEERKGFNLQIMPFSKYKASFSDQYIDKSIPKRLRNISEAIKDEGVRNFLDGSDFEHGISFGARKVTNVFRIYPKELNPVLDIDPFTSNSVNAPGKLSASKGAFMSAAFLLQRVLADNRDISPEEIEIAALTENELEDGTERSVGVIVLADELPNGSGFVNYLFEHLNVFLNICINTNNQNAFTASFINPEHAKICKTACYEDLKNYRNLSSHGLLDWRLAVALIRVMMDKSYVAGLDGVWEHIEIRDWREIAEGLARKFANSINSKDTEVNIVNGVPVIKYYHVNIVVVHPFWNVNHDPEETILSKVLATCEEDKVFFIDTFNLERRMGWCYKEFYKWAKSK